MDRTVFVIPKIKGTAALACRFPWRAAPSLRSATVGVSPPEQGVTAHRTAGLRWVTISEKGARRHSAARESGGHVIHRYVCHNGQTLPIEQARLSPGQAGLLSGWGLFTTMRILHGEPFAFERHWRRLEKDAARTRVPFAFDQAQVRGQARELVARNEVREGTARIYAIYNKIGFSGQSDETLPEVDLLLYTAGCLRTASRCG